MPWVVVALFLAVLIIKRNISKNKEKKAEDYSSEGMSRGMCLGCAIGASNIMNRAISKLAVYFEDSFWIGGF